MLAANAIVTGMVAVSFGSYASSAVADGSAAWVKVFAVLIVVAMTLLNVVGSQAVARVQTVVVFVVIGILALFAVDDARQHRPRPPRLLRLPVRDRTSSPASR